MAVYTHITHDELTTFLQGYDLGTLQSFDGIEAGVSNTNYHVHTDKGRYILTLFEEHRTRREDLPYLFAYAGHLAAQGVPCPQAYLNKDGRAYGTLKGKAAAFVKFLQGQSIPRGHTKTKYCAEMGEFTARMHVAANDFTLTRRNDWGKGVLRDKAAPIRKHMNGFSTGLETLIFDELDYLDAHWPSADDHPQCTVHLDLFPDNIFFNDREKISAMIDMYFAASDFAAFDLAIVANAWCFSDKSFWRRPAFRRLIQRYETVRPLENWEISAFQTFCRGACLRFLLSRLEEWFAYDPDKTTMKPHDPQEYITKLKFHQRNNVMSWIKE